MISNVFLLTIEAGNLKETVRWYQNVLGCSVDMGEAGKWQDIDFWGNELTLHASEQRVNKNDDRRQHNVAMGKVCVPHFGVHLSMQDYIQVKANVEANNGF